MLLVLTYREADVCLGNEYMPLVLTAVFATYVNI